MIEYTVNGWCAALIWAMKKAGYEILLASGRSDEYREFTERWLLENHIPYDKLWMRRDGDYRQDAIIKQEIYDYNIKGQYDACFVVDDRKRVVDVWRKNGLVCLQCEEEIGCPLTKDNDNLLNWYAWFALEHIVQHVVDYKDRVYV